MPRLVFDVPFVIVITLQFELVDHDHDHEREPGVMILKGAG